MDTTRVNLQAIKARIAAAAQQAGRNPAEITLIAVTKGVAAESILNAHTAGQSVFGESYVQEAIAKIAQCTQAFAVPPAESSVPLGPRMCDAVNSSENLTNVSGVPCHSTGVASPSTTGPLLCPPMGDATRSDENISDTSSVPCHSTGVASPSTTGPLLCPLEWHFIGPIQSNKTKAIAELFSWVHSIDRAKIAQRLSAARPAGLPPLQVCIEVNVGGEATKSGVMPEQALALAQIVAGLPRLTLRGLMAIPPAGLNPSAQRNHFAKLRHLKEEIAATGIALDTLSMGMSDDFEAAIGEGATSVRIGTAIFGARS